MKDLLEFAIKHKIELLVKFDSEFDCEIEISLTKKLEDKSSLIRIILISDEALKKKGILDKAIDDLIEHFKKDLENHASTQSDDPGQEDL